MSIVAEKLVRFLLTGCDGTREGILKAFKDAGFLKPDIDGLIKSGVLHVIPANDEDGPWLALVKR